MKGDWVYRGGELREGSLGWELATYHPGVYKTINAATSQAAVLYDSQNYLSDTVGDSLLSLNRSARAEGRRARTFRVQGVMVSQATTWTLGNEVRLGMRIGVFDQDANDGGISVDPDYRIFQTNAFPGGQAAVFANMRRSNLWTHYHMLHFATGNETSLRVTRFNVPAKASLGAGECLALYLENLVGGVNLRYWLACRTFVADEG